MRLNPASWRPILRGAARQKALKVADEIAAEIRKLSRVSRYKRLPAQAETAAVEASLADGRAGFAVLCAYLAAARTPIIHRRAEVRFLDQAVSALSSVKMSPSLYSGFTGVSWAMTHLKERGAYSYGGDANEPIDDALIGFLGRRPWTLDYDVVSGLVGFGVHAIERLPDPKAAECLKLVIDRLDETAERNAQGITWFTIPDLLFPHQRKRYPHGYYNLGVAHGVPGVIAFLGMAYAAGVARRQTRALLKGAVAWLQAQKLPAGSESIFPTVVERGIKPEQSSLAWCYGDPGIAAALLLAARAVGEPAWERSAIDIAGFAAERSLHETRLAHPGLCHGATGLGHLFNRMFQATGDKKLGAAARCWFRRALDLRRPGEGVAGFLTWGLTENGTMAWLPDHGLLSGAAGIALSLLAAATPIEPEWDRILLVSIPPQQ